ncbi:hypothetical protein [Bacillus sp. FJAT-45350]|uniref:hypothetical protein n=1 Tax=Bacillus sp. FJAT-45350 TaxID=2011014 RepID=UPI000BB74CED|nr:hypothetical protein [Bacillus sp. FJAT-45350]
MKPELPDINIMLLETNDLAFDFDNASLPKPVLRDWDEVLISYAYVLQEEQKLYQIMMYSFDLSKETLDVSILDNECFELFLMLSESEEEVLIHQMVLIGHQKMLKAAGWKNSNLIKKMSNQKNVDAMTYYKRLIKQSHVIRSMQQCFEIDLSKVNVKKLRLNY